MRDKNYRIDFARMALIMTADFAEKAYNPTTPEYEILVFTVPLVIQQYIENYCLRNGIRRSDLMFPITERAVQKQLHIVCDYLGYEGISTHSFRKWYATEIYKANGFNIALVQRLLQHSSAATTKRYIGIEPQRIEQAIQKHAQLL